MTRKPLRLLLLTMTLGAFFAQSTGAANFGPMAMPGAARLAFQAVSPAALKLPPAAKAAYVPPLVEPLPYRVFFEDALGDMLREGAETLKARWEAFKVLVGPDELPLKAVDIDEPTVPVPHPEFKLPMPEPVVFVAPAPEPKTSPAPKLPADRAQKRVAEILERQRALQESLVPRYRVEQIKKLPSLKHRPWNMQMGNTYAGGMRGFAPLNVRAATMIPRMEGRWLEGRGVRYRVSYLNSLGISRFDAHGVTYRLDGDVRLNPAEVVPERYWGVYPVFKHGNPVPYEIELENTGEQDLEEVVVVTRQENFNPEGGAGAVVPRTETRAVVGSLKAGEKILVRGTFTALSDWAYNGSLEQTHARVVAENRVLADHPQAGMIDPPGDL